MAYMVSAGLEILKPAYTVSQLAELLAHEGLPTRLLVLLEAAFVTYNGLVQQHHGAKGVVD